MYQTIGNVLHVLIKTKNRIFPQQTEQIMDNTLVIVMYAKRCAVNHNILINCYYFILAAVNRIILVEVCTDHTQN